MAPVIMRSARACTLLSFLQLTSVLVALIQMLLQYVSIGLMTVLYIQLQVLGLSPQVGPTARLHCMSEAVAFLVMLVMCSLKLSLLSRVTPRNLADSDSSIVVFPTLIGLRVHFLFQVNMTTSVSHNLLLSRDH